MASRNPPQVAAAVFAREEPGAFGRCSFPLLGRPVLAYPLLAATHARRVGAVFLSTGSDRLMDMGRHVDEVRILRRPDEKPTVLEEFRRTAEALVEALGGAPQWLVFLCGNSPCLLSGTIDNALALLDEVPEADSAVTVAHRHEFSPDNALRLRADGRLDPLGRLDLSSYAYFRDARLLIVRPERALALRAPYRDFAQLLGETILPVFQEGGLADIDYSWQVPVCERWLRDQGFTDRITPYGPPSARPAPPRAPAERGERHVLVTTVPFGAIDPAPLEALRNEPGCRCTINPLGRKLREEELADLAGDVDVLVAGTEPITRRVMEAAPRLGLIARVGIGLDSVDLGAARERGVAVTYTPDAPAPAVAELTLGHILNMDRFVAAADRRLREGVWHRHMGERLANQAVGVVGTGRVGGRVLRLLQGFSPRRILVHDIRPDPDLYATCRAELVDKDTLLREADVVTLHIPLTPATRGYIGARALADMKPGARLVNTSRGPVVNEHDLFEALRAGRLAAAAVDVFDEEPYAGPLLSLENCFLTCHMGSCTRDCRLEMETLATDEALRFLRGQPPRSPVPDDEYGLQAGGDG